MMRMDTKNQILTGFPQSIKDSLPSAASTIIAELRGWVLNGEKCQVVFWEVEKAFHAAAHSHEHDEWGIVVSGFCELRIENETRTYRAGEEFFIRGGAEHECYMSDNYRAVDFFASPDWITSLE